ESMSAADVNNAAVLETLRTYPDVTVVEGWAENQLLWKTPQDSGFMQGTIHSVSEEWNAIQLEPLRLESGAYPAPGRQELAVTWLMADHYDLHVGDMLVVSLPGSSDAAAGENWTVTGIVYHPYSDDGSEHSVYANFEDFSRFTRLTSFQLFQVQFTDFRMAQMHAADFWDMIDAQTPYHVLGRGTQNPAENGFVADTHDWGNALGKLGRLAMVVSCFLVVTVVSTTVLEQKRQIGMMKLLGASRLDNFIIYAGMAMVYGVVGTIPAVLLGIPLGYYLATYIAPSADLLIAGFAISYQSVLTGVVLGLLLPFLAALIPVLIGTSVSILEAISDFGLAGRYGRGLVAQIVRVLPVPLFVRQATAEIVRKSGRLVLTGITLALATGAFVGITAVFVSVGDMTDQLLYTFNYDLSMGLAGVEEAHADEVSTLVTEQVQGVKSIGRGIQSLWLLTDPGQCPDLGSLHLVGFEPGGASIQLHLAAGNAWNVDPTREGIVITDKVAAACKLSVGDTFTLRSPDRAMELPIIGISSYPDDLGFTHWQALTEMVDLDLPLEFWVKFDDQYRTGADVDRKVAELRGLLLQHGIVANFDNRRAWAEDQADALLSVGLVFNVASLVMVAVGGIGLLAMLSISVVERRREIGVMRTTGASTGAIARLFLFEGILVGIAAWLLSVPLGYGIEQLLIQTLPPADFDFTYPLTLPLLGLAGMLVLTGLASLGPALSAARQTASSSLRYQ
ncbi:MAG: FtsX-like permease family protein, partial [Chloroflexi bacterium]|nr:FtsX-like permease family protein [Chloroflexota bacterium]